MANPKAVPVRVNGSNVYEVSNFVDVLNNGPFTSILVYLRIVDANNIEIYPKTAIPPGIASNTWVTTLTPTQTPFKAGFHYTAQYSATMLDNSSQVVDYYEEQTLVGATD